ncbi:MAG: hypothetical protein K6G06_04355 [Butyrivibrio sp.]|nr:hypothetical protein [Butyrivibrio sp.]
MVERAAHNNKELSKKEPTETVPALGHKYEWVITKEANYLQDGVESYKCKKCGDISDTKTIPQLHKDGDQIYQILLEDGTYETVIGYLQLLLDTKFKIRIVIENYE